MDGSSALSTRKTVADMVRAYEEGEREIRRGFSTIAVAQDRIRFAFGGTADIGKGRHHGPLDFTDPDEALVRIRRACWLALIDKLELRRFMSIKRWDELWKQVNDGPDAEVPEITTELVMGMADQYRSQMPDMIREAVREVYDWLRPRNGGYKTNSEFGVGKRVVLSYVIDKYSGWSVSHHYSQHLSALENVFSMLDGKGQVTKHHYSEIETAIRSMPRDGECKGETRYFAFRGFLNRNLHIEFLRADLLARLNQVAGGGMLPNEESKRRKGPTPESVLADAIEGMRGVPSSGMKADFFETPAVLAEAAVEELRVTNGVYVLEPSAGNGALVRAVTKAAECAVHAVETDRQRADLLHSLGASIHNGDFLLMAPMSSFDRVIMNPPFSNHRDALHVAHAFRFLKPGGRLVAIVSAGTMFRADKVSRAFRELVAANGGVIRNNPEGSFKESGTSVRTCLVTMTRSA